MATQVSVTTRNSTTAYTLTTGARGPQGIPGERGEDGSDGSSLELTSGPVRSAAGESSIADGALTIEKTSGLQAALSIPGPYDSESGAESGGVAIGSRFARYDGSIGIVRDPITQIAVMGDSITNQNASDSNALLRLYYAEGYFSQAMMFGGGRFEFVKNTNDNTFEFATGGLKVAEITATHLPQVIASGAKVCVVQGGINNTSAPVVDYVTTAGQIRDQWLALRAAGVQPIATTVLPIETPTTDIKSWVASINPLLRRYAREAGVPLCDWAPLVETVPGSGEAQAWYSDGGDTYHPGRESAPVLGRALAEKLAASFRLAREPYDEGTIVSANAALAGAAGQPTTWTSPGMGTGATLVSKTLVTDPETGGNWWEIEVSGESQTTRSTLFLSGGAMASKNIFGAMELEVITGSLGFYGLRVLSAGAASNIESGHFRLDSSAQIDASRRLTSADGLILLTTPEHTMPADSTGHTLTFGFVGVAKFRVRRPAVLEITP